MIVILDYGVGNLTSIKKMLQKAGADAIITDKVDEVEAGSKYILPGIGSFDHGISNLRNSAYFDVLCEKVMKKQTPILGVCLGVQLFTESSEEGSLPGLGWIKGKTIRFQPEKMSTSKLKIPHMDWTDVCQRKQSRLFEGMFPDPRFYFVHSYHLVCKNEDDVLVTGKYGYEFVAGVERENIIGVQFHPEKSHKYGLKIYENFVKWY